MEFGVVGYPYIKPEVHLYGHTFSLLFPRAFLGADLSSLDLQFRAVN